MPRFRPGCPTTWNLHAVRVGDFVVTAGEMREFVPLARDPKLILDRTRSSASVEFSLPAVEVRRTQTNESEANTQTRRVSHRLARIEYARDIVRCISVEHDGQDGNLSEHKTCVVVNLKQPPTLTVGRCEVPVEDVTPSFNTLEIGDKSLPPSISKNEKTTFTWGSHGKASDFTNGAAFTKSVHVFYFSSKAQVLKAHEALAGIWCRSGGNDELITPRSRQDAFSSSNTNKWLGKRSKPDGRVLQPPRKRRTLWSDTDPGFVS